MLYRLRRSTLFIMLLALGIAWSGCAKRINSVQPVNIPEADLRAVIERAFDKPTGAIITNAEMATLASLEADRADIRELTGLEFATNLMYLYLQNNQLSSLTGLINLRELNLYENEISDLSPLADLTNLKFLGISHSRVSDLSPPGGLTNLEHLNIYGSQLSDLSPLVGLINLREVNVQANPLNPKTIAVDLPVLEAKGVHIWHLNQ